MFEFLDFLDFLESDNLLKCSIFLLDKSTENCSVDLSDSVDSFDLFELNFSDTEPLTCFLPTN